LRELLRRRAAGDRGEPSLPLFLESLELARTGEGDLGEVPETIADQHEAVHLMTIHAAKGLEFPVVFLPRLERRFRHPSAGGMLLDREGGIAVDGIDTERRRRYPTLAGAALAERRRRHEQSEELRLLYVALTRARERLVLVAQPLHFDSALARWNALAAEAQAAHSTGRLPLLARLTAASPADLLGPIVAELAEPAQGAAPDWLRVVVNPPLATPTVSTGEWPATRAALDRSAPEGWPAAIAELRKGAGDEPIETEPIQLLPPIDPYALLTTLATKTTVTAMLRETRSREDAFEATREATLFAEEETLPPSFNTQLPGLRRPQFVATEKPSDSSRLAAPVRGTLIHALLARIPLAPRPTLETLEGTARDLLAQTFGAGASYPLGQLDLAALEWFFGSKLGRRMTEYPLRVRRELPFTSTQPFPELADDFTGESLIVQGVIDAVIDEDEVAILIDYKTDRVRDGAHAMELAAHYRGQLELYARALQSIWSVHSVSPVLVLLDARQTFTYNAAGPIRLEGMEPGDA